MKLLHISDLHLGKKINGIDMLEDQRYILGRILSVAESEKVSAVLIAGDVYDKHNPSPMAVKLLDEFLTAFSLKGIEVFLISGNHDEAERLSFGSRLMEESGVHIYSSFDGRIKKYSAEDEYGTLRIHLLPYVYPEKVKMYYPDSNINSYQSAIDEIISATEINENERNILVTHQFVTASGVEPQQSDSESRLCVGGTFNIDASSFDKFDYVALGHIHSAQKIGRDTIRYCGTPLKYSASEMKQIKSVTIVEIKGKGEVVSQSIPLSPKHDMREVRGTLAELTSPSVQKTEDYIHIVLTDEDEQYNASDKLEVFYPNYLTIRVENSRTSQAATAIAMSESIAKKTPEELFEEFYLLQNGVELSDEKKAIMTEVFNEGRRGEI